MMWSNFVGKKINVPEDVCEGGKAIVKAVDPCASTVTKWKFIVACPCNPDFFFEVSEQEFIDWNGDSSA